jgi:hypothetical protein
LPWPPALFQMSGVVSSACLATQLLPSRQAANTRSICEYKHITYHYLCCCQSHIATDGQSSSDLNNTQQSSTFRNQTPECIYNIYIIYIILSDST